MRICPLLLRLIGQGEVLHLTRDSHDIAMAVEALLAAKIRSEASPTEAEFLQSCAELRGPFEKQVPAEAVYTHIHENIPALNVSDWSLVRIYLQFMYLIGPHLHRMKRRHRSEPPSGRQR